MNSPHFFGIILLGRLTMHDFTGFSLSEAKILYNQW